MDDSAFKARVKRLQEISNVIEKLDPAIRLEAFALLRGYATGKDPAKHDNADGEDNDEDRESFFAAHPHDKPADNASLLAAYHFKEYGAEPFSVDEIRELGSDVGVTLPERIDMTYVQAKRDGKNLFKRAGKGMFKPTVHGEAFLKKTYAVSKGRRKRATESSE